jgi:uncharacterized membrane protein YeaQ/YmgE (transglycosylase-associated protein family)
MNNMHPIIHQILSFPYVATALSWLAFGLVAGIAAKLLLPGQENLGWIRTVGVGILGAFIGGIAANMMGYPIRMGWNLWGFACAVVGAVALLLVNRLVTRS